MPSRDTLCLLYSFLVLPLKYKYALPCCTAPLPCCTAPTYHAAPLCPIIYHIMYTIPLCTLPCMITFTSHSLVHPWTQTYPHLSTLSGPAPVVCLGHRRLHHRGNHPGPDQGRYCPQHLGRATDSWQEIAFQSYQDPGLEPPPRLYWQLLS